MGSSAAASQDCSKNPASAGGMAGRVATGEFVSREQVRVPGICPMGHDHAPWSNPSMCVLNLSERAVDSRAFAVVALCMYAICVNVQYKTADGKSASIYRTHVWRAWPGLKNVLTLICCSTCTFVLGPSLFVGMLWVCPQQLSIAVGAVYGLHVLFGNAMHKGNLESYRWKSFDFHLAGTQFTYLLY